LQVKNQLGKLASGGVNILLTNVKSVINSHFFLFYNIYHIYFFSPMEQNIYTILITLITVLTSTAAWKFYERKLSMKAMKEKGEQRDSEMFRDDLRERVVKLETLLQESAKEKDKMRENIILLTAQVSKLEVEVEFLRKDNEMLRAENNALRSRL
jgi:hypothetical protein